MITRFYTPLEKYLKPNKVLVIYGPRRVGKTTLLKEFLKSTSLKYRFDSGDNIVIRETLGSENFRLIKEYCEGYELIIIDEAQTIKNIGKALKIMVDEIPGIRILVTGSSSFELSNQLGEPLVGRQQILKLFPIAQLELHKQLNQFDLKQNLNEYLIYGSYPETIILSNQNEKIEYLTSLSQSYLYKDILALENIRSPKVLVELLKVLAFQISSEVSLNELSNHLKVDVKTVSRYIDLLEKNFIVHSLGSFSRNLRNEISNKKKYYFFDVGVRNALINNFNALTTRNDIGALWENFLFMERLKKKNYQQLFINDYFWRTYDKKEIDLIEEKNAELAAFEFKWNNKTTQPPKEWTKAYPTSSFSVITKENYLEFIL